MTDVIEILPALLMAAGLVLRFFFKKLDVGYALFGAGFLVLSLLQFQNNNLAAAYVSLFATFLAFVMVIIPGKNKK